MSRGLKSLHSIRTNLLCLFCTLKAAAASSLVSLSTQGSSSIRYIEVGHGPTISLHGPEQNRRKWVGEYYLLAF